MSTYKKPYFDLGPIPPEWEAIFRAQEILDEVLVRNMTRYLDGDMGMEEEVRWNKYLTDIGNRDVGEIRNDD